TAPVSLTNCPGSSAIFNITATGTGLSFQWFHGGVELAGQTTNSLILTNLSSTNAGIYSVVVGDACGDLLTNSATLTVNQPVLVSTAPVSLTNCPGSSATFSIMATGSGLNYQWYHSGMLLPGQTTNSLILTNVSSTNAGLYSVVVGDACGDLLTNSATLTINQPVLVSTAPVSLTNCPGSSAIFSIMATGSGLNYQWYHSGMLLPGQTTNTLFLTNNSSSNAGLYSVVVGDACGDLLTNSATLTVNQPVLVSTAPVSLTNCPGSSAIFSIMATGSGLSYQWFHGSVELPGQTTNSLILTNVSATNAGLYSVVVGDACGDLLTNSATLTVNQPVLVSTAPVSLTNCPGSSAIFSIMATGSGLSYQWFHGSVELPGQTTNSLVLTNISSTNAGLYSVVVGDACGDSLIYSVSLTVNQPITVVGAPLSLTNCLGTPAEFLISATGSGLYYQWFHGTNALPEQ